MNAGNCANIELGYRSRKILYAVITEYVATGEPVGSRTLARRYGINLSPASIRNVLADLEEAGLLAQPHSSAGRIPTGRGFQLFVDALVQRREVTKEDRHAILSRLGAVRAGAIEDILSETGQLLASMTGTAAVVTQPRPEEETLLQIRFMPVRELELLAVVLTKSGTVQNRVVKLTRPVAPDELERVHNYLAEISRGRTLIGVRDEIARAMQTEQGRYDQMQRQAKQMLDAALTAPGTAAGVVIAGQDMLFDRPEFSDAEMIRGYLRAFEEKKWLLELLDRTLAAGGVQVLIGGEANRAPIADISVISASYGHTGTAAGTIGVIGPTRIDYAKVVPLVRFTADTVGELLDEDDEGGPDGASGEPDKKAPGER